MCRCFLPWKNKVCCTIIWQVRVPTYLFVYEICWHKMNDRKLSTKVLDPIVVRISRLNMKYEIWKNVKRTYNFFLSTFFLKIYLLEKPEGHTNDLYRILLIYFGYSALYLHTQQTIAGTAKFYPKTNGPINFVLGD